MTWCTDGSSQLESRCRSESQLQTEGFGPLVTHGWATPAKMRKKCCYGREKNLGQYSSLSPSPTHPLTHKKHHPFENKVREIYLYKELCSFVIEVVIIVDYVPVYICIRVVIQLTYICVCAFVCLCSFVIEVVIIVDYVPVYICIRVVIQLTYICVCAFVCLCSFVIEVVIIVDYVPV